jgi:putative hemolysin
VTALGIFAVVALGTALALLTVVQTLYLESLRLRAREYASLEYFKETLEEALGLDTERGALTYTLAKHTILATLGVVVLSLVLSDHEMLWRAALEACLITWLIMLLTTYAIPQIVYRRSSGKWLLRLVPLLRAIVWLARPMVALLIFLQSLAEISSPGQREETPTPAEHIDALIEAGTEEGLIEEDDRKLIQSVVAFGDKTVREVMTPRPNIVAIGADQALEDLRGLVLHEQYSRIPVFEESIDQIVGFVHVRDMFELDPQERSARKVRELVRPIRVVPETKRVSDLLREMQQDGAHMAVVVDEYGNTAGLATMEDLVEEVFGEIRDEHEPGRDIVEDGQGGYIVSGSFDVSRLQELIDFRPQEELESTTVGGLVTEWLGHVPKPGEKAVRDGIRIEVLAGNELRVEQVRVSRIESEVHA